ATWPDSTSAARCCGYAASPDKHDPDSVQDLATRVRRAREQDGDGRMAGLYPNGQRVRPTGRMILNHLGSLQLRIGSPTNPPTVLMPEESTSISWTSSAPKRHNRAGHRPEKVTREVPI
ncbi:hypothetical protein ACFVRE_43930, partial [Streptomyces sp. NPDC057910]